MGLNVWGVCVFFEKCCDCLIFLLRFEFIKVDFFIMFFFFFSMWEGIVVKNDRCGVFVKFCIVK